jgi:glycosyltransferase involved in cell wall biosynthesis
MVPQSALVSVVIPCYNHAKYLPEAVNSVRAQTYRNYEIIVIDDGSTDDTRATCEGLGNIRYVYQNNAGLSAARNAGIDHANGSYFVFLDADDYLYPRALEINLDVLLKNNHLAFVSGGHNKVDQLGNIIDEDPPEVVPDGHYAHLLMGNYIGMHATVMYARWVFNEFRYDTTLRACEDYDLYFRIARKYPVACHGEKIAAYRIHESNMSGNIPFMLDMALKVHGKQKDQLQSTFEQECFARGIRIWKEYYTNRMFHILLQKFRNENIAPATAEMNALKKISPAHALKLKRIMVKQSIKRGIKRILPPFILRQLYKGGYIHHYLPPRNRIGWGDLERTSPLSNEFGYDRGGPVDRYYIEKFLLEQSSVIQGRVFEIGDNAYTLQFGGSRVSKSDVLHVYQANETVTFTGDLTDAPQIPSDAFDCIILTQTLHLIYDFRAALRTCHRMLKPGGVLLLTVPGITHIDKNEWKDTWLWAFTDNSMKRIMTETFPGSKVEITTYGNVYTAAAFLYGAGLPEVRRDFLDRHDPSYQVIISVKATKQA